MTTHPGDPPHALSNHHADSRPRSRTPTVPKDVSGGEVTKPVIPRPPSHLSPESAGLWRVVCRDYEMEPVDLERLRVALEARDRAEEARGIIARDGMVMYDDKGRPQKHPACLVERDATATYMRALRELDLQGEPAPQYRRPAVRVVR